MSKQDMSRYVLIASVICGVLYGLGLMPGATPAMLMAGKGVCVGLLAVYAYLEKHTSLSLALALGAMGDIFLASPLDTAFMHGLAAFLLGHIVYISIFRKDRIVDRRIDIIRLSICASVVMAAGVQAFYLWDKMGDLRIAASFYMAVLAIMACTAVLSRYALQLAGLGAVLFLASDIVLGFSLFDPDMGVPRWLNWWVYYPAQLLLAVGIVAGPRKPEPAEDAPVCNN